MEKPAPSDPELLADWLGRHREPAFHALVARYAGLVHATARRTCGDDSMAAEASQLTFIALAQKAKSLTSCGSLGGWLHLTAMMQAKNLLRKSQRENRKRQLLHAAMETESSHPSSNVWQEIQPVLDEALAALSDKDREALLLRFYRSLSIREIAANLGIATDAAQKRIDRATERLRGKLARRGVQVGGSLSAAMIAGFAADAQAAVPAVSLLAGKALAANAASAAGSTSLTTITMATTFKSSSVIPPVVALILAGSWIGGQHHAAATLKDEIATLRNFDRTASAGIGMRRSGSGGPERFINRDTVDTAGSGQTDWNDLGVQVRSMLAGIGSMHSNAIPDFRKRVLAMNKDELLATLDEINRLDWTERAKAYLGDFLIGPLAEKDPELALRTFSGRMPARGTLFDQQLQQAMHTWAAEDPAKASEWFDAQVTAGAFDGKSLKKDSGARNAFENQLLGALLSSDATGVARRLEAMPGDRRSEVFQLLSNLSVDEAGQLAFARLVREQVPEKDQIGMLAQQASALVGRSDFEKADVYLDRIAVPTAERNNFLAAIAEKSLQEDFSKPSVTERDIDRMREWLGRHQAESVEEVTAKVLSNMVHEFPRVFYSKAAALAEKYADETGSDGVIIRLLESGADDSDRGEARKLAERISDEARREEFLNRFK